jgi:CheY-like chemotaxis protein/anti-sigma regulatory factor (Ser/Thr protein kinase)
MKLQTSKTNIIGLSEEVFNHYKSNAQSKNLIYKLNIDLPKDTESIATDSVKFKTILSVLIDNAIKFTKAGSVEINIHKDNDYLVFSINDTGIGIPDNKKHLIFEKFMQADVSNSRQFEGSGLGLSIAKAYVEMLRGEIWVESDASLPDVPSTNEKYGKSGSRFFFTIPYDIVFHKKNDIQYFDEAKRSEKINNSLKVLIAEDDESSEIYIALALKITEKEVLKARNGMEAVEICRLNSDIDLIIMDIKMPEMDGYEATRLIRQFNKNVIIIAQTAYVQSNEKETALASGCNDYISKPYTASSLKKMINKYISIEMD